MKTLIDKEELWLGAVENPPAHCLKPVCAVPSTPDMTIECTALAVPSGSGVSQHPMGLLGTELFAGEDGHDTPPDVGLGLEAWCRLFK